MVTAGIIWGKHTLVVIGQEGKVEAEQANSGTELVEREEGQSNTDDVFGLIYLKAAHFVELCAR